MITKFLKNRLTRRKLLGATAVAAGSVATASLLPKAAFSAGNAIKIGFLAPLTGPVSAWGKPGLDGCEIWGCWRTLDPVQVSTATYFSRLLLDG